MKNFLLFTFYSLIFCSCQSDQNYYPDQAEGMKDVLYDKYKTKLDKAYVDQNDFQIGIQLANLKAPPGKIYESIEAGVKENSDHCKSIYDWFSIFKNFKNNVVKSDTSRFLLIYELCLEELGANSYAQHEEDKIKAYEQRIANRETLDSSKFDLKLIQELELIEFHLI